MNDRVKRALEIVLFAHCLITFAITWYIAHNYPVDASALTFAMILFGSIVFAGAVSVARIRRPEWFTDD